MSSRNPVTLTSDNKTVFRYNERMDSTFTLHALASGSSGNATLLRAGEVSVLIDAGIGMRKLVAALASQELKPGDLSGAVAPLARPTPHG